MKGDVILDYVEFQQTPNNRCDLFVSSGGCIEKLASGYLKPFVTHLRALEGQVTTGDKEIRLENPSQNNCLWFNKGTVERFIRFVTTPEVIERVKNIDNEISQLEQVRNTMTVSFTQMYERSASGISLDVLAGSQKLKDSAYVMRNDSSEAEENQGDSSKGTLLRAMEARLNALYQEQNRAFSRANSAGFNTNNVTDLISFADHFGADRLRDACMKFLDVDRKLPNLEKTFQSNDNNNCTEEDLYGTKRRLDFVCNIQASFDSRQDNPNCNGNKSSPSNDLSEVGSPQLKESTEDPKPSIKEHVGDQSYDQSHIDSDKHLQKQQPFLKEQPQASVLEGEIISNKDTKEESPSRRLSVQAAISLFESKKTGPSDPPVRKLGKQDSRKALVTEAASPSSEKLVLKRLNTVGSFNSEVQLKQLRERGVEEGTEKNHSSLEMLNNQKQVNRSALSDVEHIDNSQICETNVSKSEYGGCSVDARVHDYLPLTPLTQFKNEDSLAESNVRSNVQAAHDQKDNGTVQRLIREIPNEQSLSHSLNENCKVESGTTIEARPELVGFGKELVVEKQSENANMCIDLHMPSLMKMAGNEDNNSHLSNAEKQKGKFYEQYSKLRDAKIRGEHPLKKAEKEAKLRSMQETLEKSKIEMQKRKTRIAPKSTHPVQSLYKGIQTQRVVQLDQKVLKDEQDEENNEVIQDTPSGYSSPSSPALTPRSFRNQVSSTKSSKALPKSTSNGSRSALRPASSSPKTSLKSPLGSSTVGKIAATNNTNVDGSPLKVMGNKNEVRRAAYKNSSAAKAHQKVKSSTKTVDGIISLPDGSTNAGVIPGITEKGGLKHAPSGTRKAPKSISKSKVSPTETITRLESEDPADQQEVTTDAVNDDETVTCTATVDEPVSSSVSTSNTSTTVAPNAEELSRICEIVCEEDTENGTKLEAEDDKIEISEEGSIRDLVEQELTIDSAGSASPITGIDDGTEAQTSDCHVNTSEDMKDNSKLSEASGMSTQDSVPDKHSSVEVSYTQDSNHKQKDGGSMLLSELFAPKKAEFLQHHGGLVTSTMSFREAPLSHGKYTTAVHMPLPEYSAILERGAISSRFTQQTYPVRQVNGAQKSSSMLPSSPKEPSKGFKRLLHFGRKSRQTEAATVDCLSSPTAIEYGEGKFSDDLIAKMKLKSSNELGSPGNQFNLAEGDTGSLFRTSIPPPPANFKLREEQISGGNMIKAPRSFFSLPTFRSSKGSEGKQRF